MSANYHGELRRRRKLRQRPYSQLLLSLISKYVIRDIQYKSKLVVIIVFSLRKKQILQGN